MKKEKKNVKKYDKISDVIVMILIIFGMGAMAFNIISAIKSSDWSLLILSSIIELLFIFNLTKFICRDRWE